MTGDTEKYSTSEAQRARQEQLENEMVERAKRNLEEELYFDNMDIARAMVAVAFKRLESLEDVEWVVDFYRRLQKRKEDFIDGNRALGRRRVASLRAEAKAKETGGRE